MLKWNKILMCEHLFCLYRFYTNLEIYQDRIPLKFAIESCVLVKKIFLVSVILEIIIETVIQYIFFYINTLVRLNHLKVAEFERDSSIIS